MQKGFSAVLVIIIGLLVIGGGVYFYTKNNDVSLNENDNSSEEIKNEEINIVPSGWVEKKIELQDEKVLTYIVPIEYQNIVYAEVVNKPIDSRPENEDLNRIGGSVFDIEKYEIFYGGETKTIAHYWYVNATNYKWVVTELDLGNSTHLEFSYTYKTEQDNPNISKDLMDRIAGSSKIK